MPRPNRPRDVFAEDNLAARIAAEREREGWTYDSLAKRMTDAGCPLDPSAVYKIEKGKPRRRIVVDELVAFARVFGLPVDELLLSPELAAHREIAAMVVTWNNARTEADASVSKRDAAWQALKDYAADHPDVVPALEDLFGGWAEFYFEEEHREGAAALKMWELTSDEKFSEAVDRSLNRARARRAGTD